MQVASTCNLSAYNAQPGLLCSSLPVDVQRRGVLPLHGVITATAPHRKPNRFELQNSPVNVQRRGVLHFGEHGCHPLLPPHAMAGAPAQAARQVVAWRGIASWEAFRATRGSWVQCGCGSNETKQGGSLSWIEDRPKIGPRQTSQQVKAPTCAQRQHRHRGRLPVQVASGCLLGANVFKGGQHPCHCAWGKAYHNTCKVWQDSTTGTHCLQAVLKRGERGHCRWGRQGRLVWLGYKPETHPQNSVARPQAWTAPSPLHMGDRVAAHTKTCVQLVSSMRFFCVGWNIAARGSIGAVWQAAEGVDSWLTQYVTHARLSRPRPSPGRGCAPRTPSISDNFLPSSACFLREKRPCAPDPSPPTTKMRVCAATGANSCSAASGFCLGSSTTCVAWSGITTSVLEGACLMAAAAPHLASALAAPPPAERGCKLDDALSWHTTPQPRAGAQLMTSQGAKAIPSKTVWGKCKICSPAAGAGHAGNAATARCRPAQQRRTKAMVCIAATRSAAAARCRPATKKRQETMVACKGLLRAKVAWTGWLATQQACGNPGQATSGPCPAPAQHVPAARPWQS